jgi:hypothetical protein
MVEVVVEICKRVSPRSECDVDVLTSTVVLPIAMFLGTVNAHSLVFLVMNPGRRP